MTSKIKTFENACKALKIDSAVALPDVSGFPEHHQVALIAHAKLILIAEALNEGWRPDWNDTDQVKYTPWFKVKADKKRPSGFGLSCDAYAYWYSLTSVGSRLCFKSEELAEYAAKQFIKIYEEYYLFK